MAILTLSEHGLYDKPLLSPASSAPIAETKPKDAIQENGAPRPDTGLYGATGTPIVSGFVTDLQEYNPTLRGRNAFATYEKMRRSDADVAALLQAMKLPIRSADVDVIPGVKENEPDFALAKEIAEFVKENLFTGMEYSNSLGMKFTQSFESVMENALLCLDFGCSGHEDLWTIDGGKVRLRKIAPRLPITFYRFLVDDDGESLKAIQQWGYRGAQFVTATVPADKFTLFTLNQEGGNFYGISALRTAYQAWWTKNALYRITSIAAERNAMGIPVITAGLNPAKEDMDLAKNWVSNLAVNENSGLTLPNGWLLEIMGIKGRIYDPLPYIQHMSEQIVRSGLAMFMALGTTQSGSRSLGNTMVDFFQMSLQATATKICGTMNEGTIRRLVDFNYQRGAGKNIPYPRLIVPHIAVLNPLDILAVLKDVGDAKVDLFRPSLDRDNYIAKKLGLPLLKDAAEERVRYAPVVQRIEGTETGNPEQIEEGKGSTAPTPQNNSPQKTAPQKKNAKLAPGTSPGSPQPVKPGNSAPTSAKMAEAAPPHATAGGRALSRQLKPHELKHDFDGHADRQDTTAANVARALRAAKPGLIREAAARAAKFDPTTLDKLELPFPHSIASRLARALTVAHNYGHQAVYDERKKATGRVAQSSRTSNSAALMAEPGASAATDKPTFIAEASVSDLNNWLTSRTRGSAVDAYKKGLTDRELEKSIIDDLTDGSDSFLDRIAAEASRSAVAGGRYSAFQELDGEIAKYARSEAMDANTCEPCAAGDGEEYDSLDDVDWSPGDDCDGGDACRGQLMPIFEDEGKVELG